MLFLLILIEVAWILHNIPVGSMFIVKGEPKKFNSLDECTDYYEEKRSNYRNNNI